jgi:hypothetical protein
MDTRTHNLVGQAATGTCASRVSRQSVLAARVWSLGYVVPTTATKPVIPMFAEHANNSTRRLKEPSP